MLDYLFRSPNVFTMREARERFINQDEIFVSGANYVHLENGDIWRRRRTRTVARRMHSWFFYSLLRPFHNDDDEIILRKLIRLLRSWREIVGLPPTRIPMSYHDETTAQRVINLSCMLHDYEHLLFEDERSLIIEILSENAQLLSDETFHSAGTNHGMYQDLALIVVSKYLDNGETLLAKATSRLDDYFRKSFTSEGLHKEQSPQYHYIVSNHLREYAKFLTDNNSEAANQMQKIFEQTEEYATMVISPIGKFPPVSDTSNDFVSSLGYSHIYESPEFQYAITQGMIGTAPDKNMLIAPESGVAIFREDWKDPNSVYVYFSSSYNSDYHKHSDELSLYLVHRGTEILREAGPNGYEMQDPYTKYAFSSFAHNTLVVNNEGLPRTDPDAVNKVGLREIAKESTNLVSNSSRTDFDIEGWNHRFTGVKHTRRVSYSTLEQRTPKVLVVADAISSASTNDYKLFWHLGPDLSGVILDDTIEIKNREGAQLAELKIQSNTNIELDIVVGQTEPQTQGWYFPKMGTPEPAQTVIFSFTGASVEINTEISLW